MTDNYVILSDMSADLDPAFAKHNDIHFIPMTYIIGDKEKVCEGLEDEKTLKKFYDAQRHGKQTKTSQISPQNYIDAFEPYLEKGQSILYISLSGGLSGTYNSSLIAADDLSDEYDEKIVCVDSLGGTVGMGLLIEEAVKNKKANMSITENAKDLESRKKFIQHWFMVDDLMFLKRGGRISGASAVFGTALGIKPILNIDAEGKLVNIGKKRGTKLAMAELVEKYKASSTMEDGERVYVVHADNKKNAESLKKSVLEVNPKANVSLVILSPVIGSHTGPDMLAIAHLGNTEFERK